MARPKKQVEEVVEVVEPVAEVLPIPEPSKFPYKIKLNCIMVTVVAESIDPANGMKRLHSSDGCTYHAPKP